ncbi:FxSxx-COOH system tetratricopeptide repeat protein [Protofrankia symbiont of Coriaria ruscifolia]|uniref:FxSxx-COOH system tetratricopeptide repeat protein n=1 Tax=Protofrankia symbiont of Coriaria ruscifolia TaxID=1306542 RepID=UPI001A94FCA9|nr:FxSxx-COOH system tetratricopeptide repeat protein [Protofrankia symbiont of Coriaria ruscifolia]
MDDRRDFFVSYTGRDQTWAEWIAWTLEAAGYTTFVQMWDFIAGTGFAEAMHQAAQVAERTVAVLSAAYLTSGFAAAKWQAASLQDPVGRDRKLLVVRVEDCDRPGLLGQLVAADLFGVDRATAAGRLLAAAAAQRAKPPVEPEFPGGRSAPAPAGPVFPPDFPRVWNVPPRLAYFVGRSGLLEKVDRQLAVSGAVAVCALHGLGGVGKTALAVEYAHRHADRFDVVWWVPAQDPELVAGHVAALGAALGLADGAAAPVVLAVLRRRRLRWLLLLDNVEDPDVVGVLRPSDGAGRLLVTSRRSGLDGFGAAVEVAELDRAEAVGLLSARVGGIDPAVAGRICVLLGDLALAVEQAAGYLVQTGMPPAEYAELLAERLEDLLAHGRVADRPGITVGNLWTLSVERLRVEAPAAVGLLELCAVAAPDPLPVDLFVDGVEELPAGPLREAVGDRLVWVKTVGALVDYGLTRRNGPAVTTHRLIAAAIRAGMSPADRTATAATLIRLLRAALPAAVDQPTGWPRWRSLLPHVRAVLDGYDDGGWDERTAPVVSWLCDRTGSYLEHHGRPDTALPYLRRGLVLAETRLGANDPATLTSRHNLAGAYQTAGRVAEAIGLYEQTLTDRLRVLGPHHPLVVTVRDNLAAATGAAGRPGWIRKFLRR